MSHHDQDDRTRLLLSARVVNGVDLVVDEDDQQLMQQMVKEGLFHRSGRGYWWTKVGERAAEEAWRRAPVRKFKTRYRNHPKVRISVNGRKEEMCHVSGLWVREKPSGGWLIDHPNGKGVVPFESADKAIEWALEQVGKAR